VRRQPVAELAQVFRRLVIQEVDEILQQVPESISGSVRAREPSNASGGLTPAGWRFADA
jgi:hypothetical protein